MHEIHDRTNGRDVGLWQDAMAEVEDVTGPSTGALEDLPNLSRTLGGRRQEGDGFEVTLDGTLADTGPGSIERHSPIDTDHVAARGRKVFEKRRCAGAEVNHRDIRGTRERERFAAVRLDVGAIIVGRETADPAIEYLQRVRTGAHLCRQKLADEIRQFAQ